MPDLATVNISHNKLRPVSCPVQRVSVSDAGVFTCDNIDSFLSLEQVRGRRIAYLYGLWSSCLKRLCQLKPAECICVSLSVHRGRAGDIQSAARVRKLK